MEDGLRHGMDVGVFEPADQEQDITLVSLNFGDVLLSYHEKERIRKAPHGNWVRFFCWFSSRREGGSTQFHEEVTMCFEKKVVLKEEEPGQKSSSFLDMVLLKRAGQAASHARIIGVFWRKARRLCVEKKKRRHAEKTDLYTRRWSPST